MKLREQHERWVPVCEVAVEQTNNLQHGAPFVRDGYQGYTTSETILW